MLKVGIISLGCSRNLLDSEVMLGSLKSEGCKISDVEKGVDICIVNTCAFVESAREESVDTILEACRLKREGRTKHVVVCGCLPQLYKKDIAKSLGEVDLILGTSDFPKIASFIKSLKGRNARQIISDDLNYLYDENSPRFLLTPKHYAYVKIAEGCSNLCSFCIISRLRGPFRSRSIESITEEVRALAAGGVLKEINLIGQDTTLYGADIYGRSRFPELLRRLSSMKNGVKWIRILYTHPAHYTKELISTIRDEGRICRYLDLPIQHISDKILKKMNRHTTKKEIIALIGTLRRKIKKLIIRTSIIVGFPGETDKDFKELVGFIRDSRFERMGAFIYSREEGTPAARFAGQVPDKVKSARFDELMKTQQKISRDINKSFIGRRAEVLIDEALDDGSGKFLGRTQGDAPEVDGSVYVGGKGIKVGGFYKVRINDTLEYDLAGEKV